MIFSALIAVGLSLGSHYHVQPARPTCPGDEVRITLGEVPTCDVNPPQTLTVILPGADGYDDAATRATCDDMGGYFVLVSDARGQATAECRDTDF